MSIPRPTRAKCEAIANPKPRQGWHQDNASPLEKCLAREILALLDENEALALAKALIGYQMTQCTICGLEHGNEVGCGGTLMFPGSTHSAAAIRRLAEKIKALEAGNANRQSDKERLDWYIQIQWVIEMDHRGWYLREPDDTVAHEIIIGGFHETPRQAIDAGIVIAEEMNRKDQATLAEYAKRKQEGG